MFFLNASFIWVASLGIIPIVIHFWNKKMVHQKTWSVLRFFPTSVHEKQNRIHFHEWILLILRLLLIGIATVWLMQPARYFPISKSKETQKTQENYLTYIQQFVENESSEFETPIIKELPKQKSVFPFQIQQKGITLDTLIISGNLHQILKKAFDFLALKNEFNLKYVEEKSSFKVTYGRYKLNLIEQESEVNNENQTFYNQDSKLIKVDEKIVWNAPFGETIWNDENQNPVLVQVDSVWFLPKSLLKESYVEKYALVAFYFAKEVLNTVGIGVNTPVFVKENQRKIELPNKIKTYNEIIISLFFLTLAMERVLSSRRDA